MHAGNITTTDTAAGRVFAYLDDHRNEWVDAWELTMATHTTAVSTRVSEVRHQLFTNEGLDVESKREDGKWFYRLVELGPIDLPLGV